MSNSHQQATVKIYAVFSEKAKLEKCITEYNDLLANREGVSAACVSLDDAVEGKFLWSFLTGLSN